jgi:phosphate transport system protein
MPVHTEEHTVKRFDEDLARLRGLVSEMGKMALEQIQRAVDALNDKNLNAAREVVNRDHVINGLEVVIDDLVINLIAMRQPMGSDLRLIMAIAKGVTDLERIGDEAAKIARMTLQMYEEDGPAPNPRFFRDVTSMSSLASEQLQGCLEAMEKLDLAKAVENIRNDVELDVEFQAALRRLTTYIMEDHRNLGHIVNVVFILKALERIGDHSKNISEYVVYLIEGKQVRHVSPASLSQELMEAKKGKEVNEASPGG